MQGAGAGGLYCTVLYCVCRVLVLGAGYVSAPVVEYLTRDQGLGVTVAAALKSGLEMEKWRIHCYPLSL